LTLPPSPTHIRAIVMPESLALGEGGQQVSELMRLRNPLDSSGGFLYSRETHPLDRRFCGTELFSSRMCMHCCSPTLCVHYFRISHPCAHKVRIMGYIASTLFPFGTGFCPVFGVSFLPFRRHPPPHFLKQCLALFPPWISVVGFSQRCEISCFKQLRKRRCCGHDSTFCFLV
jgi:hypothetical protein